MANTAEQIFRGLMGYPPMATSSLRPVYFKNVNGKKVDGDHKKSDATLKPEDVKAVGNKVNQSLRNYFSKEKAHDYHKELLRYLPELHEFPGAQLTDAQKKKLLEIQQKLKIQKDRVRYAELEPLINQYVLGGQNQIAAPPVNNESMVRPEGTPSRNQEDQGEPPPKRPNLAPRVLNPVAPAQTEAAVPIEVDQQQQAPMAESMAASGGNDAAGNGAMWRCISYDPVYTPTSDGMKVEFKGSRLMYTWALDMRTHNVTDIGDFIPMAHSYPWEWIPSYCTPGEWNALPWATHDMAIKRVGVQITPVGKETQFNTAVSTATVASNEHLVMGYKAVGLNKRKALPSTGYRRIKNNVEASKLITNSSDALDYADLRKRFWGPLSDFTVNEDPTSYGTSGQVSTAELSIRELECVAGVYVDKFDKATKANNKACFGSLLKDRYLERFPLTPAMGTPIISEVYEPKCGIINTQPHRVLLNNSKVYMVNGPEATSRNVYNPTFGSGTGTTNKIQVGNSLAAQNYTFSRNANIGETVSLGSYHALVEKYRFQGTSGDFDADQASGQSMPMLTFGVAPIRLINLTSSSPDYVNARVVWKIDYFMEIHCKFQEPLYPFATNVSADGTVYPANMYTSLYPHIYLNACSYSGTANKGSQPKYENVDPTAIQTQLEGYITYSYTSAGTASDYIGAGGSTPWVASTNGLNLDVS